MVSTTSLVKINKMWDQRLTVPEMARKSGFSNSFLYTVARQFHFKFKPSKRAHRSDGLPNRSIAVKAIGIDNLVRKHYKIYPSIRHASKELNVSRTAIGNCLNKWSKSAGGFIWEFVNKKAML